MAFEMPQVPAGSGKHPFVLIVLSANSLEASSAFYAKLFGWQFQQITSELTGFVAPGGPAGALRGNVPSGFPGMVPYIGVDDVDEVLKRVVSAGGTVERPPWDLPGAGRLARFKDPGGTIYGLTDAMIPDEQPRIPMPIGSAPKPLAGAICHLEMYAADGATTAGFFSELFGWGMLPTMPQYMAFDPGACVGGVFQSHTPTSPAVAYVYATDVPAKLAEIEASGGRRIGEPMRMPGAGCFGYFKDPSGTSMGLIGP
jgi:predicted enzyme related to lactoylglutathione lyase